MLDFTGERYLTNLDLPEISYEHWHRYIWLQKLVANKQVLDVACGEGYGSRLLAEVAKHVIGVDVSEDTVTYASSKYLRANLEFLHGSAAEIPIDGEHLFDIIISFETIEHLDEHDQHKFMAEAKRLLRPDGLLFISTPNRLLYSDIPNYANEFHRREFYPQEFIRFLKSYFTSMHVFEQRVYPVSYLWPLEKGEPIVDEYQLEFVGSHFQPVYGDKKEGVFLVAVCTNAADNVIPMLSRQSLLIDISDQAIGQRKTLVEEQDIAIKRLRQWIDERDQHLKQNEVDIVTIFAKHADDIAAFNSWIAERDARLAKQEEDINALNTWIDERDARLAKQDEDINALNTWIDEHNLLLNEQQHVIVTLQTALAERDMRLAELDQQISEQDAYIANQSEKLLSEGRDHQLDQAYAQILMLQAQLEQIQHSVGWKVLLPLWRLRARLLPHYSVGSKVLRAAWRSSEVIRSSGIKEFVRHTARKMANRSNPLPYISAPNSSTEPNKINDYEQWITENEPNISALLQQTNISRQWARMPSMSIVTPVYNPEPAVLQAMIDSVLAQTYQAWELWLIDGNPSNTSTRPILERAVAIDARIKLHTLTENQGIVSNTNAGIRLVTGEYVAFVDHDDTLAPFALFEVAKRINERAESDLIYSDSDLLSANGTQRFAPFFKPDWSPAIMLSANYATHLCVVRTSILRELNGLTPGTDGAQDWDLILRISERTNAIEHIPKILYHWRESPGSTATDIKRKPYVMSAQIDAITQHLQRQGIAARAYFDTTGYIRVTWPLLKHPLVSIIIPSRNVQLVHQCISSISTRTSYQEFEIIIVDTTHDGAISRRYEQNENTHLRILSYTAPFNYSTVNNLAAREAAGEILLFLNDDTEVIDSEWLTEMVRWSTREQIGVVGAKLLTEDGRIQHAGVVIGMDGFAGHPFTHSPEGAQTIYGSVEWYRNYSAVTGACLMIRRSLFEQVKGFDEQLALCGNDVELCLRVGALGYQIFYTPFARLRHFENVTRGKDTNSIPKEDFVYSYLHYKSFLEHGDPFFNRNLSNWSSFPRPRRREDADALAFVYTFLASLGFPPTKLEEYESGTFQS